MAKYKKPIIRKRRGRKILPGGGTKGVKATEAAEATMKELKGNRESAERLWDGNQKVRAAKFKAGGANILEGSPVDKKLQKSPQAQKVRKGEGKAAADLQQPAAGSLGKIADDADTNIRSSKVAAKKANEFDKALSKKQKQLETYETKRDSLKGVDKIKFIAENQTRIKSLKASIKDMISRGGPGGKSTIKYKKKTGGSVVKKRGGGMTRQGLYPAEEARSGTTSQAKRKRYMKSGGVVKRAGGGKAYNKKVMARMDAGTVAACYNPQKSIKKV